MTFFVLQRRFWRTCCLGHHDGVLHMDAADRGSKFLQKLLARCWGGKRYWSIYRLSIRNYVPLKTEAAFSPKHLVSTHKQLRFQKHRMLC